MSGQLNLFSGKSPEPEGLKHIEEFISPVEERALIAQIAMLPLRPFQFGMYEGHRRVASFGFRFDYTLRQLQEAEPIPDWLASLIKRVETFGGPQTRVQQVLCTEYNAGVGIGWHRDKPHFDRIFRTFTGLGLQVSFPEICTRKNGNGLRSRFNHGHFT